ncbi:MAG: four helix bundle protein [Candidatus Omnitrophica bacterium]|nr:four helix bundle protein [Candidatus Omnitrophota bacterium]
MKAQRVEDLDCWREARVLVNMVFKKSQGRAFRKETQLRGHVTGAALDVMNAISEGFVTGSDSEFIRTLKYALRSVSEVQTSLYAALDLKLIGKNDFMGLYDHIQKTRKVIDSQRHFLSGRHERPMHRWRGRRNRPPHGPHQGGGDRPSQPREEQRSEEPRSEEPRGGDWSQTEAAHGEGSGGSQP